MSSSSEETQIPLGVVLITVGAILLIFAAIGGYIVTRPTPVPVAELLATAPPPPTPLPEPTAEAETAVALLPETPTEAEAEQYPAHFVSALEAAEPNVGQPVRIVIPEIELDAPINPIGLQAYEQNGLTTYQWQVPTNGIAGWHHTSARLGATGNTVLNGHHNIFGEVFRDLNELEAGAEITIHDTDGSYTYTISEILILEERGQSIETRQKNAQWIADTDDERITLVTCWPYTDNSHRLIVVAYPTETEEVSSTE